MKWFYRMKMRTKLIAGFLLILSLIAFIGGFSLWNLMIVNRGGVEIGENFLISAQLTGNLNLATSDYRVARRWVGRGYVPADLTNQESASIIFLIFKEKGGRL